jgi:hypothetical protein
VSLGAPLKAKIAGSNLAGCAISEEPGHRLAREGKAPFRMHGYSQQQV